MRIFSRKVMNKSWTKIITLAIFINISLSSFWLLRGNLIINFDLSRDLMIWHDIYKNKHLTLIGGHSGTINGIFHGPAWYYLNLPAIFFGEGNPIVLGWFWILLSIVTLSIIYFIGVKLFGRKTALISTLLYSTNSISNFTHESKYFYNPYGAVMLTPIFFYLLYTYIQKPKVKILITSLFILGFIIQFQMAFGVPILVLTTIYLIFLTFKRKLLKHLLSFFILLIPLSTYLLFEIRHEFIQLKTVLQFLSSKHPSEINNWVNFIYTRLHSLIFDNFKMLVPVSWPGQLFFSILFLMLLALVLFKKPKDKLWKMYFLFSYFYFGYFLITYLFWGEIVNYYWPFLPLTIIFFCALILKFVQLRSAVIIFSTLVILNYIQGLKEITNYNPNLEQHSFESWDYNYNMAKIIYLNADKDFGYYIFTPDLFGYSQRYAMEYVAKEFKSKKSFPFVKKELTYLIVLNPQKDRTDINSDTWKTSEVKITRIPDKTFKFKDYKIEKYILSEKEIEVPANPNLFLINNLYFR